MMSDYQKREKAFQKLNTKLRNLEGSHGLIHAEWDPTYKTAFPAYGFSWGYNENPIEHIESFNKALKKALTLCKNYKYNGFDR